MPPIVTASPTVAARSTRKRRSLRAQLPPWLFLAPFVIAFTFVFLAPIAYAIVMSLFRTQLVGGTQFVGIDNYVTVFTDAQLWRGVFNVILLLFIQVPIMLAISVFLAIVVDSGRLHGVRFFRIAVFLPYAVPAVVATLIWGFMYSTRYGLIGEINRSLGSDLPSPLAHEFVLASIGNIVTWEYIGYNMLIFYAALRVIDRSLYEAAAIDGAGELRIARAIKLPAMQGAFLVTTVFSIIGVFQLFSEPQILQSLAPNAISTYFTPNMYAYNLSFAGQQLNYSAAVAIVVGLVTVLFAYTVQARAERRSAQ
ncbi:sugar ABC transporter permease [Microbacterium aquimaris]|uniref:carbohydrate ABC transporter permease n=1 Tax=Microbacterium aquimaris TaxID=459816 RepID=UPI002AD29E44|nr:sugar ABC transporter permease [Microbacterium aquimaris]MDZ8275240.1 sugar ABC transporter permease [Microbacterium aquimaris]